MADKNYLRTEVKVFINDLEVLQIPEARIFQLQESNSNELITNYCFGNSLKLTKKQSKRLLKCIKLHLNYR